MNMLPVETNKHGILIVSIIMLLAIFTSIFSVVASLFRQNAAPVVAVDVSESQSSLPVEIKEPPITVKSSQNQLEPKKVQNAQLPNIVQTDCFKLGVIFNLNQLSNLSCDLKNIFPSGWNGLENWGMWSTANAEMQIDLPKDCQDKNTCDLKLFLPMGIYNASATKPKEVVIKINSQLIEKISIGEQKTITIPLESNTLQGQTKNIKIQFSIPDAESPGVSDARILGVALGEYQLLKHNAN